MVHRGPARGCRRCRDRHVKCDGERPVCNNCSRLGYQCPGYGHAIDLVLRDQTASTRARYQQNQNTKNASRNAPKVLPSIPPRFEVIALDFLFTTIVFKQRCDWRESHYPLENILRSYSTAPDDSALAHTVRWLATLMVGTCFGGQPHGLEKPLFGKAVKSVREAISDPSKSLEDETLSAVIILQFGCYPSQLSREKKSELAELHQKGLEALVLRRGSLNYKDRQALVLFAAARNNAVTLVTNSGQANVNLNLWSSCSFEQLGDLYTPALQLDTHHISIAALKSRLLRNKHAEDPLETTALQCSLSELLDDLSTWELQLPKDWIPQRPRPPTHQHRSAEVIYLVAKYFLLRLEICQLIQAIHNSQEATNSLQCNSFANLELISLIIECMHSLLACEQDPTASDNYTLDTDYTEHTLEDLKLDGATGEQLNFLEQLLCRLENILCEALKVSNLPDEIIPQYHKCLSWASSQMLHLHGAFAWPKSSRYQGMQRLIDQ